MTTGAKMSPIEPNETKPQLARDYRLHLAQNRLLSVLQDVNTEIALTNLSPRDRLRFLTTINAGLIYVLSDITQALEQQCE